MTHLKGWRAETQTMRDSVLTENKLPALITKLNGSVVANGAGTLVDLRSGCSPVENQQDIGSCVANAIVSDLEFLMIQQGTPYVDLSRMFVYYNARLLLNETDKDDGSYVSLAMSTLKKEGVCPESTYPYDTDKVFMRPTWEAYREAYAHTLSDYYKIDGSGMQLHRDIWAALDSKHPVVFGTPVWASIQQVGSDGMIPMPDASKSIGGHAMLIVGYDMNTRRYIVRNSWGTGWGDRGYGYLSFDYLETAGANDFHVGTLYK